MNGSETNVSSIGSVDAGPADAPIDYIVYALQVVEIVEGSWMVLGNGLIAITLLWHKTMQKNRMATAVALAIPDGVYGFGVFVGAIRRLHLVITRTDHLPISGWECMLKLPTIFYIAGSQMTAMAMVLISADRYLAAAHFAYYYALDHKSYARRLIMSVMVFGVATSALAVASSYFGWGDDSMHEPKWAELCLSTWAVPKWYATGYTVFVAVGGYLSIVIYVMVLRAYRNYVRSGTTAANKNSNIADIKQKRERRVTITMGFVTLMTLFFHSIPYTMILSTTVLKMKLEFVSVLNPLLWNCVCFNSLANIFVYLKRHDDIRSAMADVIRGRFKQIGVQPSVVSVSRPQNQTNN